MNNQFKRDAAHLNDKPPSVVDNPFVEQGTPKYQKPVLICYGDVRDITLGPTPGFGESGCACDRRPGATLDCPVPPSPCFP